MQHTPAAAEHTQEQPGCAAHEKQNGCTLRTKVGAEANAGAKQAMVPRDKAWRCVGAEANTCPTHTLSIWSLGREGWGGRGSQCKAQGAIAARRLFTEVLAVYVWVGGWGAVASKFSKFRSTKLDLQVMPPGLWIQSSRSPTCAIEFTATFFLHATSVKVYEGGGGYTLELITEGTHYNL